MTSDQTGPSDGLVELPWVSQRRSIRICGVATSLRLEHFFWNGLERVAEIDEIHLSVLISDIYQSYLEDSFTSTSFSAYLRVSFARHLDEIIEEDLPPSARSTRRRKGRLLRTRGGPAPRIR